MGEVFAVEPSPTRLVINKEGKGRVHFRVTNASDHEVEMQAQIRPEKRAEASWFAIDGKAGRTLAKGGTATVVVDVTVPPGTKHGDDYEVALELADAKSPAAKPEKGPGVVMNVESRFTPHGRGFSATIFGAIIGGLVGFIGALALATYEIGHGVRHSINAGWTIQHTVGHIVTTVFLGLIITIFGALIGPWLGEVIGSGLALKIRHHWGVPHTMLILAILTPIWSIIAAVVLIVVFKQVPGRQFIIPVLIWLVTLVLVPPIFARMTTVLGRERAH